MLRTLISNAIYRQAQSGVKSEQLQSFGRSIFTSSNVRDAPVAANHDKVSTPDEGDIGRGTHQAAPVETGDPSDVVPNLVMPDETSGNVPQDLQEAQGIKSGSPSTPELATQTTAKPGQAQAEVATTPTPGLPATDKIPSNKP